MDVLEDDTLIFDVLKYSDLPCRTGEESRALALLAACCRQYDGARDGRTHEVRFCDKRELSQLLLDPPPPPAPFLSLLSTASPPTNERSYGLT